VVNAYNQRYKKLNAGKAPLSITRADADEINYAGSTQPNASPATTTNNSASSEVTQTGLKSSRNELQEVVVTGYGTMLKRNVTGSATYVRGAEIQNSQTVEQALQGRVAGMMITQSNVNAGAAASISIRGQGSLNANRQPLYVLDGMPVNGNINDLINVNDIQDITVLRDAQAGAIYGSMGANGVIIINSKTWRNNRYYYNSYNSKSYRLKDMEDVEYMQEIMSTPIPEKLDAFQKLQLIHGNTSAFYFDMAQHFFHSGLKKEAFGMLMNAAEMGGGSAPVQQAVAYVLESWKMFDEAILIYQQLADDYSNNIYYRRDLAWAYYQQGNYQLAVTTFYDAIMMQQTNYEYEKSSVKATLLYEMNQVIGAHKELLDISMIPASLIRELSSGFRVVLSCNSSSLSSMKIKEPHSGFISEGKTSPDSSSIVYGSSEYYYNGGSMMSYQTSEAKSGKYGIWVNYNGYYQIERVPSFIRITSFKNFGKANQSIDVENVEMDNQYGEIEIASVNY
jgi:TonB-dependent SusC/RagA subfamily outer membrane receptor